MTICRQLKVNCRQQSKDKCLQKRNRKLIGENRNWTHYWIVEQELCRIEQKRQENHSDKHISKKSERKRKHSSKFSEQFNNSDQQSKHNI